MARKVKEKIRDKTDYNMLSIIIIAMLIGIAAGLFAVLFRLMIGWAHDGFYGSGRAIFNFLPGKWWRMFVPCLAGLIVGPLTYYFAREAKGHGVPEVMEAVALKGGKMRMRVIFIKAIASASSIGAGASVGREGPIVQMGSGIGSVLAQKFKLSEDKAVTCVGCGAAAGIAATFNAPIAGVIFALEVILGEFTSAIFIPIVVSSVTASVISRILTGDIPAFYVQAYSLNHPLELIFYIILGIVSAGIAVLFVKTLYKTEDLFDAWRGCPEWVKPVIGGAIVGIIGLKFPEILGVGYGTIEETFKSNILLSTLIFISFIKIVATSITLGSGHSGGVFAPSLFIGATLGGAFGMFVKMLYPQIAGDPGAYAIVGMGAVVAGTTQAPITAVLIIFEMTRDYRIILPLMLAVVFSTYIYSAVNEGSIYTLKLIRRGVDIRAGKDVNVYKKLMVREIMTSPVETVRENDKLEYVINIMHNSKHNGFPVVNEEDELSGIITLQDVRNAPLKGIMELPVRNVMTKKPIVTYPDEVVDKVFNIFRKNDLGHLPVVLPDDPNKVVGIITHSDLIKAYNKKTTINGY